MGRKSSTWTSLGALAAWTLIATPAAAQLSIFPADPTDTFNAASDCNGMTPLNCSLREAVVLANQTPGQDTIFLVFDLYNLTIPRAPSDDAQSGDLDITDDTIIDDLSSPAGEINAGGSLGTFQDRHFHVQATGTLTLHNVRLTNGFRVSEAGGAVLVDSGGDLVINESQLTGNAAWGGGAIALSQGGTAAIDRSLISGNNGSGFGGGGIHCAGALSVTRTSIEGNTSGVHAGVSAVLGCNAVISKSTISGNQAINPAFGAAGGGLGVNACGSVTLNNVTVSGNSARGAGGGIIVGANFGFCPPGIVTANNVTLAFNTADSDNNDATSFGGGFHGNTAACNAFPTYCLQIKNSIIGSNKDGTTNRDCIGLVTSGGNNMVVPSLCTATSVPSDLATDPQLDPALALNHDNWVGFDNDTKTHGLIAGSPAIDSGGVSCETTDQRGIARVGTCDRGAFEADVCGNNVARSPEECDPPSTVCTNQCRDDNPISHNTPFLTDKTVVGLVVAYQDCLLGNPGLHGPENLSAGACNVKPFDEEDGPCEFDSAISGAKGFVEINDDTGAGGEIKFRLRLAKLKSSCYNRTFRIKASVDETVANCSNGNLSCTEVRSATLDDVVPSGSCTVGDGTGGTTAGLCDYTAILGASSAHRVRNGHRTAMEVRQLKVIDVGSGLDAFVPGVLLK